MNTDTLRVHSLLFQLSAPTFSGEPFFTISTADKSSYTYHSLVTHEDSDRYSKTQKGGSEDFFSNN